MNISVINDQGINATRIKVVGVGGAGCNVIERMSDAGVSDVDFISVNTDLQALSTINSGIKIGVGQKLTKGLGAGGDPDIGAQAAEENREDLMAVMEGADMVFITAGMGGGTGTGAAPVAAAVAREAGALTVGVITKPFAFEGKKKMELALEGIARLREAVDTLIIIPNEHLLKMVDRRTSMKEAFHLADEVLRKGVFGVSDLITKKGIMNIDFADVRTVMQGRGDAFMGIGEGKGSDKAIDAATDALNNPLLEDVHFDGARWVLVNVTSGDDLSLVEFNEIVTFLTNNAHPDALIKAGHTYDAALQDEVRVTIISTGFDRSQSAGVERPVAATTAPAVKTVLGEKETNILSHDEWAQMSRGLLKKGNSDYLIGRNSNDVEYEIPTYLRDMKAASEGRS
jgi:cell division protein FtsZ